MRRAGGQDATKLGAMLAGAMKSVSDQAYNTLVESLLWAYECRAWWVRNLAQCEEIQDERAARMARLSVGIFEGIIVRLECRLSTLAAALSAIQK